MAETWPEKPDQHAEFSGPDDVKLELHRRPDDRYSAWATG